VRRALALGGSFENAIVDGRVSRAQHRRLRSGDEFAKHKILDAMGDLYLLGRPLIGAYRAHKSGHALNNKLLRALLADRAGLPGGEASRTTRLGPTHSCARPSRKRSVSAALRDCLSFSAGRFGIRGGDGTGVRFINTAERRYLRWAAARAGLGARLRRRVLRGPARDRLA